MFISWLPCQCGVNCLFAFLLHAYICCLYVAFQSSNSLKAELSPFYLKHAGCVGRCIVTGTDKVMKNSPGRLDWLMAAYVIYEQVSNELKSSSDLYVKFKAQAEYNIGIVSVNGCYLKLWVKVGCTRSQCSNTGCCFSSRLKEINQSSVGFSTVEIKVIHCFLNLGQFASWDKLLIYLILLGWHHASPQNQQHKYKCHCTAGHVYCNAHNKVV